MKSRAAGLTLLELMIAIGILGLIAASLPIVLDGALGLRERQETELRLEREIAALADQWATDTQAAQAVDLNASGCVLHLAAGLVRFRVDGGSIWRETRRTGQPAWSPHPQRPLARLVPGETIQFRSGVGTITLEVVAPWGPWSRTVAPRAVAS
jgi:prepilin-type N-terminal cleavage/methylation domain-containing protein